MKWQLEYYNTVSRMVSLFNISFDWIYPAWVINYEKDVFVCCFSWYFNSVRLKLKEHAIVLMYLYRIEMFN